MKNILRGASALAIATVSVLALSACDDIAIDSLNGQGTCGGNAFTLSTDQNAAGDNITIDYTGPSVSSVSLFVAQGFYVDDAVTVGGSSVNSLAVGDNQDAYALKLDVTAPGWSTSGSGNSTSYSFSGSIETPYNNVASPIGSDPDVPPIYVPIFDATVPAFVGVDCDTSHTTGVVSPSSSWAAAASMYPNNMLINALEVVASEPIANGARVTLRYPADALSAFGSFSPEAPFMLGFLNDNPVISNDSLGNMWAQAFSSSNNPSASSPVPNGDGTFTIDFTGNGGPLADGDYLLLSFVPNQAVTEAKVVFSSIHYTAAGGFQLQSLPFLPALPSTPSEPTLPNTGVSATQAGLIAGAAALLALSGIALVAIRRRKNG